MHSASLITPHESTSTSGSKAPPTLSSDPEKSPALHVASDTVTQASSSSSDHLQYERWKVRLSSAFCALFVLGWADGVTGTLLPYFKNDFHLSFMTSSLLFVASALGYALGTLSVETITRFLGQGRFFASRAPSVLCFPRIKLNLRARKPRSQEVDQDQSIVGFSTCRCRFFTLVLASIGHTTFFVIMGTKSGFPSMLVAYGISAFSRSFILATLNVYVSSISKRGLGFMYGSWALGAFGAPLVCQSIVATGIRWANFYFGSLVLASLNISFLVYAYTPTRGELQRDADFAWSLLRSSPPSPDVASAINSPASPTQSTAPILQKRSSSGPHSMWFPDNVPITRAYSPALRKPRLWASAIFSMLYTGSESATQGFIVIYLLNVRGADPNTAGYVTSGFWGGMAIGRFLWGYLGNTVTFRQRKWIIQGCMYYVFTLLGGTDMLHAAVAFCMHLLIWFVPSCIENAVSTAAVGLVYGPIYPANIGIARDLLPTELHLVSLAIVAAFGSFGAALFPFITGTLSTVVGPRTLPYITVSQCIVMFGLWTLFPSQIPDQL
ncbi:MFS general substrate transporter [Daedaleopsis nitida]|nr:MFS general substrate transporter [Daedaleopsis nitida]